MRGKIAYYMHLLHAKFSLWMDKNKAQVSKTHSEALKNETKVPSAFRNNTSQIVHFILSISV